MAGKNPAEGNIAKTAGQNATEKAQELLGTDAELANRWGNNGGLWAFAENWGQPGGSGFVWLPNPYGNYGRQPRNGWQY